ncbi:MAG: AmmeMemoRadiSam system radical SAM enzyme [Candidatus Heimdallarchaeota archaeon]
MINLHKAMYYTEEKDSKVKCRLCPNLCLIKPGERGKCNVRINTDGKLYTTNYGLTTSGARDPIEKKPLYHFLPSSCAYSFGTVGCNLFCQFCQNWQSSQASTEDFQYGLKKLSSKEAAKEAVQSGCATVAYTYNEPLIWYEWVLDTAKIARQKGLKNILVTNGYIEEEPLRELLPFIDGANVDLKGDKGFYKEMCGVTRQEAVLRTCKIMKEQNVHLEITNLIVTSKNDSDEQLQELIDFVVTELGADVPLHFSRYFPNYKLDLPATSVDTLFKARDMAHQSGVQYVYLGNIRGERGNDTHCKNCGAIIVKRSGYVTNTTNLTKDFQCKKCGTETDIIWN